MTPKQPYLEDTLDAIHDAMEKLKDIQETLKNFQELDSTQIAFLKMHNIL
jgi:hypothetical protein